MNGKNVLEVLVRARDRRGILQQAQGIWSRYQRAWPSMNEPALSLGLGLVWNVPL